MIKRLAAPIVAAVVCVSLSGCVSPHLYVDPALGDVRPEERVQVVDKRPVQLVFNFQTSGATNANVTRLLRQQATDAVVASGLFSQVTDTPAANGSLLAITVNNVPEKNAASQGIVTGLTLGLAGSLVTDYYVASASYSAAPGAPTITSKANHALHTQIGAGAAPAGMTPAKSFDEGVKIMLRQSIDHLMLDLSKNPAFQGQRTSALRQLSRSS